MKDLPTLLDTLLYSILPCPFYTFVFIQLSTTFTLFK